MNRTKILIGLAQAHLLTDERQYIVRSALEDRLPHLLLDWGAPDPVLAEAGIPAYRPDSKPALDDEEIKQRVDQHLAQLGIDAIPIYTADYRWAQAKSCSAIWQQALRVPELPRSPYYGLLPVRPELVFRHHADPAWQPLLELIEHRIHPYGPLLDGSAFVVVRV